MLNWNEIDDRKTYRQERAELLVLLEDSRLTPYVDSVGDPTIGIGFNLVYNLEPVLRVMVGKANFNQTLLGRLEQGHPEFRYVHREDNAVALAVGTALTGGRAAVLMQNSGFGQSVNVLASLVEPFDVPLGLVVSMRGTGVDGTRENRGMGEVTVPVLDRLGVPWRMLGTDGDRGAVAWFETVLANRTGPVALLVPPESFGWSAAR